MLLNQTFDYKVVLAVRDEFWTSVIREIDLMNDSEP